MQEAKPKQISQVTIIGRPQPQSWADYRHGALENYGGGHRTDGHLAAFHHGIETVFNLLEGEFPPAEQCKAAPEMLAALQRVTKWLIRCAEADEERAKDTRFSTLSEACTADAKNYRATAKDLQGAIDKARGK